MLGVLVWAVRAQLAAAEDAVEVPRVADVLITEEAQVHEYSRHAEGGTLPGERHTVGQTIVCSWSQCDPRDNLGRHRGARIEIKIDTHRTGIDHDTRIGTTWIALLPYPSRFHSARSG
jgi:hypothetical protein